MVQLNNTVIRTDAGRQIPVREETAGNFSFFNAISASWVPVQDPDSFAQVTRGLQVARTEGPSTPTLVAPTPARLVALPLMANTAAPSLRYAKVNAEALTRPNAPPPLFAAVTPSPASPVSTKRKAADGETHVKRPRNAFILFRADFSKRLRANQAAGTGWHQKQVSSMAGKAWQHASESVRTHYQRQAMVERRAHAEKYPDYTYEPASKKAKTGG